MGQITAVFGTHDDKTLAQLQDVASRAEAAAIMADGHLGYVMPIGGVAAYDNKVSVVGVGYDIACGNCAIKTDLRVEQLTDSGLSVRDLQANPHAFRTNPRLVALAREIGNTVSFGIGRRNEADDAPVDHELFHDAAWWAVPNIGSYRDTLIEKAREQLGTVGGGNHYVDVFTDEEGAVWVGVHFGSRGFGHTVASNFIAISQGGTWGDRAKELEVLLDLATPAGHDYWHLMNLAGRYAYAGREWVTRKVVQVLGGRELEMVHNHHNFAWKESHWLGTLGDRQSRDVVVVRKGATPAFPGQKGFIGGSMGDDAVIVQGTRSGPDVERGRFTVREGLAVSNLQNAAMFSTVHGAGRVMSRTAAAGKTKGWGAKKRVIAPGLVSRTMVKEWMDKRPTVTVGGGLDESPYVYRRLPDVLREQGGTIDVLHRLTPLIVVMADDSVVDPFKD